MRMPGFCGPTYQSVSPNIDAEYAMNIYCERSESQGAKTPIALLRRPGLKLFTALPEGGVPGLFAVNGRGFAACSSLYELGGSTVNLGSLGAIPTGPTQIIANETQLLVLNNGALFVLTLATNILVAVNMGQFNGPVAQIGFADGYGIATIQNSHTFQVSNLEDFTTWGGLNIATVSLFPDNLTSMICDHREVALFSGKKSAVYYNAGAGFPPFIPIQGAFLEDGSGAAFATVQADNSVFYLSLDERGTMVAKRLNGYTGQRVSTHAVEFAWQGYTKTSDAVGYTCQMNGHIWWVLRFPTPNKTWVYDISTGYWHEWGYWEQVSGSFSAHRSTCHAYIFGKHLVGDWASGNIYEMSDAFNDDFGNPIRWVRRSPTVADENKYVYFSEFELDVETGLGPQPPLTDGQGNPRPPQVNLRWSNDATKTWSSTFKLNCGKAGQYNARARKTQLGRARKRVFEVSATDPVPWRIADAYIEAQPQS